MNNKDLKNEKLNDRELEDVNGGVSTEGVSPIISASYIKQIEIEPIMSEYDKSEDNKNSLIPIP